MSENEDEELARLTQRRLEEIMKRGKMGSQEQPTTKSDGKPIILTDANFQFEISRHLLMVVDFWAAWCGPCRMVSPVIEQLATEYAGRVSFGKLNVDENPMVSNTFGIQSIPTILVFRDGRQVDGILGAVPKSYIESKFKPYLSGTSQSAYG